MGSREVIRALKDHGWFLIRIKGSHHHFAHETKSGIVTVPHPKKDLAQGTLKSIEQQAKIKLTGRSP
jgi:predicted RNA binding protein YcfA (HicA-like mRNA interferase family)